MRVCLACREHPLHFNGGYSIAAWNTAKCLTMNGNEVTYWTSALPGDAYGHQTIDGIEVQFLPGTSNIDPVQFQKVFAEAFKIHKADYKWDVLHCQGDSGAEAVRAEAEIPAILQDHGSRIAYLQTMINDWIYRRQPGLPDIMEWVATSYVKPAFPYNEPEYFHDRRYKLVLATSTTAKIDFETRHFLTNVRLFLQPIFVPKVARVKKHDIPLIALFAGDLDCEWKCGVVGLDKLAATGLKYDLLMIGLASPGLVARAKTQARNVTALGHISEAEVFNQLPEADMTFECSTHHLGLNMTGPTSLGCGVPVIAYPTAAHRDVVGNNQAGILVDPESPTELKNAIETIMSKPNLYQDQSLKRFDDLFSPQAARDTLKGIYAELA